MDRNDIRYAATALPSVALRKESVDRNLWWGVRKAVGSLVALRKESVDRNLNGRFRAVQHSVALRKESVDRNGCNRKNWVIYVYVALRKESVDRNPPVDTSSVNVSASLSARRAWIEITQCKL